MQNKIVKEAINLRHQIHENPEIGIDLPNTRNSITNFLNQHKIEWTTLAGAIIGSFGRGEKTVLLRADMDALQMQEESNLIFSSQIPGAAHCCGHDIHTSMLAGALCLLKHDENELNQKIAFIFQPDEEGGTGAKSFVEAGGLTELKPDAVIAMHVDAKAPLGKISCGNGKTFASNLSFDINISGRGGHGARLYETNEPLGIAVELYSMLHRTVAREVSVFAHPIFSIISIESKPSYNIIASKVKLRCSLRNYDEKTEKFIMKRFNKIIAEMDEIYGTQTNIDIQKSIPSLTTSKIFTADLKEKISKMRMNISEDVIKYGSEDMAFITEKIKNNAYLFLGAGPSTECGGEFGQHNPKVIFNEAVVPIGIKLWYNLGKSMLFK